MWQRLFQGLRRWRKALVGRLMSADHNACVAIVAIDGPSGAGKGTVAREVANRMGWNLLDSGALYRLVGLAAKLESVDFDDADALVAIVERSVIAFSSTAQGDECIELNGQVVTDQIRT